MKRDDLTMKVAANIATLMKAREIDAAALARKAHLNPTGVYDILSGKSRSPKIETIGKIADALGVPIGVVFEDDPIAAASNRMLLAYDALPEDRKRLLLETALAWSQQSGSQPA